MPNTILYPGQYVFICPCGCSYEIMTLKRRTRVEIYCFYCKQVKGKYIKIMEEILDFTYNWNNKLNCEAFSTLRLRNDKKYYRGARKIVRLKGINKGTATIVGTRYFTIDMINEAIARLDTGYSVEECKKIIKTMYKNKVMNWNTQQLVFCILVYDKSKERNLFDET